METEARAATYFSRHSYIRKKYQSKMVLKFCGLAVLGVALYCAIFYTALDRDVTGGYAQALEGMRFVKDGIIRTFLLTELVMALVIGASVVVVTLLMSHRIAGPLWRIERTARAIGSGDLTTDIRLRERDEMKPLADKMNSMTEALRSRVNDIEAAFKALDDDVTDLKNLQAYGSLSHRESLVLAGKVADKSKALLSKLNQIRTG